MSHNHLQIRARPRCRILNPLQFGSIIPASHSDHPIPKRVTKERVQLFPLERTALESQRFLRSRRQGIIVRLVDGREIPGPLILRSTSTGEYTPLSRNVASHQPTDIIGKSQRAQILGANCLMAHAANILRAVF